MLTFLLLFFSFFLFLQTQLKNDRAYTNDLHTKRRLYNQRYSFSGLVLNASYGLRVMAFRYAILCVLARTTRKLRVVYISTFHISNDCSTIGDVYSLDSKCVRATIIELWLQTHISCSFRLAISAYLHA